MANIALENVLIATTPRFLTTQGGTRLGSFRVAESLPNGKANWFTVTLVGELCAVFEEQFDTVSAKGSRIDCEGALRVLDWDNGERSGTSVEVELKSFSKAARPTHNCNCENCAI